MKAIKIVLLLIWVVSTAVFVLGFLTPLEFASKYYLFSSFLISFNGAFALPWMLTSFVSLKLNRMLFSLLLSLTLLIGIYNFPGLNPDWQNTQVLFRDRSDSTITILNQKIERENGFIQQRNIQVIPATPIFNWVKEVKTIVNMDENKWVKVDPTPDQE